MTGVESVDMNSTFAKVMPPMAANPLYETGPEYDVIPEPMKKPYQRQLSTQSTNSLTSFDSRLLSSPDPHAL